MNILPAIDILDGKAVRLHKGLRASAEVVGNPVELARRFRDAGAPLVHVVDLNGAFGGHPQTKLVEQVGAVIPMQIGGGVRSEADIERLLGMGGTRRVVVGTWAFSEPERFRAVVKRRQSCFVVAVDVRDGLVAVKGWTETHPLTPDEAVQRVLACGVCQVLVTDVSRDGTLGGPNVGLYTDLNRRHPELLIPPSGGVAARNHLDELRAAEVVQVIVGKALYAGTIPLEALRWT